MMNLTKRHLNSCDDKRLFLNTQYCDISEMCLLFNLYLLCLSLFQDGQAMLWDLNEGKHLYTLDGGDTINALCFSPNRYWLCAATGPSIKIWVSLCEYT